MVSVTNTLTVYFGRGVRVKTFGTVADVAPPNSRTSPSPKTIRVRTTPIPCGTVIWIAKLIDAANDLRRWCRGDEHGRGRGTGITVTVLDTDLTDPRDVDDCGRHEIRPGLLVNVRGSLRPGYGSQILSADPSPQLTLSSRTGLPPVGTVTTNVNVAGSPALGGVDGGVIATVVFGTTVTFAVPDV